MLQEVLKQKENEYNIDDCGCRKEFWKLKIKRGVHIGQAHPDHNLEMSFKEKQEWALRFSEFFV